jgi:hypothetical protein
VPGFRADSSYKRFEADGYLILMGGNFLGSS